MAQKKWAKHAYTAVLIFEGGTYTILMMTRLGRAGERRWFAIGAATKRPPCACVTLWRAAMAKRSKRDPIDRQEHYTQLIRSTMETPAWRALPATAQALYPWFKLEWRGPNNNKNGKLRLSVRQAAAALGVSRDTAARAIHELQAKGFLHMTEAPCLGTSGAAKSPAFEITEIALPSANPRTGRKLYLEWREGHDFAVSIIASNNPQGLNGKTKPCPKNQDGVVLKMMTK